MIGASKMNVFAIWHSLGRIIYRIPLKERKSPLHPQHWREECQVRKVGTRSRPLLETLRLGKKHLT